MTNNTKLRLSILSLVALALMVFVIFNWLQIKRENTETAELAVSSGVSEEAERKAQAIRDIQIEAASELAALEAFTMDNDKLVPLIESIEEVGRNLNIDLEIASVEKSVESDSEPQIIRMVISAEGTWAGTYALLKAVESLPYRVMVERVSLSKEGRGWKEALTIVLHSFP